ncbi:hypothetical protein ABL78_7792 [Leptomonas seymouri]|uniref:Uncharacterized protein n=1 Tax=Leptomonas seymouri TaxID=5684 RepID=A0A0N0P2P1_LEPSE|nr:hypothetical protein ABL78_7792 [Leptomonas seymouri]|eukprot:KPI83179.1 hypothetical protein ABL78_7792 [Leptomonas seymouri]
MFAHTVYDDVSSVSAADLAQRLVEHSSRRKLSHAIAAHSAAVREVPPESVGALLWDAKTSGSVAPRSALLRDDIVREDTEATGGALLSLSLSADIKFHFARAQQRRFIAVLSSRTVSTELHLSSVDETFFYWMEECYLPRAYHGGQQGVIALQKCILRWALHLFAKKPLMKNISMEAIEVAFPALLAYAPPEREELAKQAAEMLGRGTVIWYGGTLIKQFHESSSIIVCPLLSLREERCAATLLFALANAHQIMTNQVEEASHAARYLLEAYGARHVALSPALTRCLLIATSALAARHPGSGEASMTVQDILGQHFSLLAEASMESVASFIASTAANPPPKVGGLLSQVRNLVRQAMCRRARPLPFHEGTANAQKEAEEDANTFFSDITVLKLHGRSLRSFLTADLDTQLPVPTASSSDCMLRQRLLEWAPKWWNDDPATMHTGSEACETELKINAKTAAAALREPLAGDRALLAVIQHARKRRRGDGAVLTPQAVQAALDEADLRLKRRTFLQLMDKLTLCDGRESRVEAATHFLQQHHVGALHIHRFTEFLTATHDK